MPAFCINLLIPVGFFFYSHRHLIPHAEPHLPLKLHLIREQHGGLFHRGEAPHGASGLHVGICMTHTENYMLPANAWLCVGNAAKYSIAHGREVGFGGAAVSNTNI